MNHTVPYGIYLRKGTDHSHLFVRQLFNNQFNRRGVIRHIRFLLYLFPACRLMGDIAAVNAVLSYFAQQAAAQQVEFSVKAQLPEYTGVADPDLTVLFGNLLENALTACMQEASPRIVVRITADAHTLCAAVDNTFTGAVRRTTGGFLSTKHAGLGLGTASVRSIAEKYHGVCRLEPRDGMFCASVLLELPQEKL